MRRSLLSTLEAFSATQPKDLSLWQEHGFRLTRDLEGTMMTPMMMAKAGALTASHDLPGLGGRMLHQRSILAE